MQQPSKTPASREIETQKPGRRAAQVTPALSPHSSSLRVRQSSSPPGADTSQPLSAGGDRTPAADGRRGGSARDTADGRTGAPYRPLKTTPAPRKAPDESRQAGDDSGSKEEQPEAVSLDDIKQQVLRAAAEKHSPEQIAGELGLSVDHVRLILRTAGSHQT